MEWAKVACTRTVITAKGMVERVWAREVAVDVSPALVVMAMAVSTLGTSLAAGGKCTTSTTASW